MGPLKVWARRCPDSLAPAPSPSHPLSHKDSSRWRFSARHSLVENSSKRRWWRGLRGSPRTGSRRGRAVAPARGEASPRGPRAARQAARAAPLQPRPPRGAHPSAWGGPLGARTQRANRVRPRLGAVPCSPSGSESTEADACARHVLACRGSQAAIFPAPGGLAWSPRPSCPGNRASGAEAGLSGQWAAAPCAPQVRAPRGLRRGRLPLFPSRPGGARAPSPRGCPRGARPLLWQGGRSGAQGTHGLLIRLAAPRGRRAAAGAATAAAAARIGRRGPGGRRAWGRRCRGRAVGGGSAAAAQGAGRRPGAGGRGPGRPHVAGRGRGGRSKSEQPN